MFPPNDKPCPVLLLGLSLGPGGSERQLTEIALSLDRSRFTPHVGYFREGFRLQELQAAGIPTLHIPVTSFLSPGALRGAWIMGRYCREQGIRLVHAFDYPLNCFGVPVARFFRIPVVLSSQRAHRALNPRAYNAILRLTDHMVDAVVGNCQAMQRHLAEDEHVPARRIRFCYNGLDTAKFHPGGRQESRDGKLIVGVVCVLRPEKGLNTLIEAFAAVAPAAPLTQLVIIGSGPELKNLEELARTLGIAGRCAFYPTMQDVAEWLRKIDIFVLPSLSEAFSNSLMEAMACGCAVVASAVGGNPELVIDGETGLLFAVRNAADLAGRLKLLIEDGALRRRLGAAASIRIRDEFSIQASARRMEQIYTEFLSEPRA